MWGWVYCARTRHLPKYGTMEQEHAKRYLKKLEKISFRASNERLLTIRKRIQTAFIEVCGEFGGVC
jgi:hypothetical protein